jgi:3-oxoacyl-[acyl-carrier-protein] synthase-3
MIQAYINCISYYLPKQGLTNDEINNKFPEWSIDKIASKTGIYNRKIADIDEFASDMAISAANNLFLENNVEKESIDYLLYCTQSPDYFLPTTACILQNKLGLSNSIGALDFNLGCSGFVYGLSLSKALIVSGIAKKVLLITAETYSKFIHPEDKTNLTIFGDAASATIISSEKGLFSIKDFVFGTDGTGASNLIIKNGGLRNIRRNGVDVYDGNTFVRNDNNLFMNGGEIFNFTSKSVPLLVENVLNKNNTKQGDVDTFIFHQANKFMLDFIRKKIGIPLDRFFIHLKDCGNTVSSTIPIALKEFCECADGKDKTTILLAGFGVGYSWAGCIIKKVNNEDI